MENLDRLRSLSVLSNGEGNNLDVIVFKIADIMILIFGEVRNEPELARIVFRGMGVAAARAPTELVPSKRN